MGSHLIFLTTTLDCIANYLDFIQITLRKTPIPEIIEVADVVGIHPHDFRAHTIDSQIICPRGRHPSVHAGSSRPFVYLEYKLSNTAVFLENPTTLKALRLRLFIK